MATQTNPEGLEIRLRNTVYEGNGIPGWGVPWIYVQDTMPTAKDLGPYWQFKPA